MLFFFFFFNWLTCSPYFHSEALLPLILLCRSYDEDDEALEEDLGADFPAEADAPARVHKVLSSFWVPTAWHSCYNPMGFCIF